MTGAYALNWPGQGAWAEQWGRGCGPQDDEPRGRRGRGRYEGPRGGYGREMREDDPRGGYGGGRGRLGGGRHGGGRHGRGQGPGFPLEALADWAMARGGGGHGGPGRHGHHGPTPEQIEALMALRGMRGGPGPFGRGGPRGRGRRRRGDVRLAVLRLLSEEPRNGYQLMQTIEERSEGQWRPSPGSMYPTLSQLEDEGLILSAEADGARRFEITDAGREALEERAGEPDPWAPQQDADAHAMSELGPLVLGIGKAVWQVASVGDESQRTSAAELLAETRRRLYGILAEDAVEADDTDQPEASGEAGTPED
ncbi:MAG TPA: PadR family transcriptional regulator [Solirubrobacteraceae bacterium]|jgi:DNA-binding PadR family transcriptional regulator